MAVGGPCSVVGCKTRVMSHSQFCHKHGKSLLAKETYCLHTTNHGRNKCKRMAFRGSGLCYQHQDSDASEVYLKPLRGSNIDAEVLDAEVLRYNIDGANKAILSKNIDGLVKKLGEAKKFWIVNLGLDEAEFVQFTHDGDIDGDNIRDGVAVFEHWRGGKKISSFHAPHQEQVRPIDRLRSMLTGEEDSTLNHLIFHWSGSYWDEDESVEAYDESLEYKENVDLKKVRASIDGWADSMVWSCAYPVLGPELLCNIDGKEHTIPNPSNDIDSLLKELDPLISSAKDSWRVYPSASDNLGFIDYSILDSKKDVENGPLLEIWSKGVKLCAITPPSLTESIQIAGDILGTFRLDSIVNE